MSKVDWVVVKTARGEPIGAVGFLDNRIAIVGSFYDDRDINRDGRVSIKERATHILMSNSDRALTDVLVNAAQSEEVFMRDDRIYLMEAAAITRYFMRMAGEAAYNRYFAPGVSALAKPLARRAVDGAFARFVVTKGMENAVKRAFEAGIYA